MTAGIDKVYFTKDLTPGQRLVLFRQRFRDQTYLHLRLWYQPEGEEEFRPGRGLVLPRSPGTLHELADALHELAEDFPSWTAVQDPAERADNTGERAGPSGPAGKGGTG